MHGFVKSTAIAAVGVAILTGCVPLPIMPRYNSESRQNVGERVPDFIVKGTTARADVLLHLGEPDRRGDGDRWFAYGSRYKQGGVALLGGVPPGNVVAGALVWSNRYRRIVLRFDDRGVVTDADFVERACFEGMVGILGAIGESPPCFDVTAGGWAPGDALGSGGVTAEPVVTAEPSVPEGERLAAVFAQVVWLDGSSRGGRPSSPVTGNLTLTDRSLVFVGQRSAADGPAETFRILYADIAQVESTTGRVLTIELSAHDVHIFEARQSGTFGGDGESVVGFIRARVGKR